MKTLLLTLLFVMFPQIIFAQSDHHDQLLKDAVVIRGDKMVMEGYGYISGVNRDGDEYKLHVKYYSEAPKSGLVSRDNFIALTDQIYLPTFLAMGKFQTTAEPPDNLDYELYIYMEDDGLHTEFRNNLQNTSKSSGWTWEEMFGE